MVNFNLNAFLGAVANILDTIEIEIFGMATNHSKRIAYISIKIASELQLTHEEIFDLTSLAILHDNGACMKILHDNLKGTVKERINLLESRKEHCSMGEDNLKSFPFLTNPQNIIRYHHEKYDGSGFFGLSKDEIPLLSQIISLADTLDLAFDLRNPFNKPIIKSFVADHRNRYFSDQLADAFLKISAEDNFGKPYLTKALMIT